MLASIAWSEVLWSQCQTIWVTLILVRKPSKEECVDFCGSSPFKESSGAKSAFKKKALLETLSEVFHQK